MTIPNNKPSRITQIRYKFELLLLRGFVRLFRLLPLATASGAMGYIWRKIAPLTRRHTRAKRLITQNLPEIPYEQVEVMLDQMWDNLGRTFIEGLMLDRIIAAKDKLISYDKKLVADLTSTSNANREGDSNHKQGIVFIGMHCGNWELAAIPLLASHHKIGVLYRRIKNPYVDQYICDLRQQIAGGGLHKTGVKTLRWMIKWLNNGNYVSLLGDRRDRNGQTITFFNRPAHSSLTPADIALRLKTRVILFRVIRIADIRFKVETKEIKLNQDNYNNYRKDSVKEAINLTTLINNQFEQWIREMPEQWAWIHDRWG